MTGSAITLGVEEEFHIVDTRTRHLVPRAGMLLDMLPDDCFTKELQSSTLEANSRPFRGLEDLARDLGGMRAMVVRRAESLGLGIVAAGSVPLADIDRMKVSPDPRYEQMLDDYQLLTREQLICGTQVHAEITDRELALAVAHRLAPWAPPLLALSSSSPYWLGADTGYGSYRTMVWQRWPTAGPMARYDSVADYERMIQDLIQSGVISDPGMIYFDIRPSAHVPTVELRVCDSCPRVDDIVLIAGLFRALVARELEAVRRSPGLEVPLEGVRAATWQAARSGLEGELVDPVEGVPRPAAEVITRMVNDLRPYLEEAGDWELISGLAGDALARGSSAARQREAFARRGLLGDVVDMLLAETRSGGWEPLGGDASSSYRPAA
ncbi:glutamate--cysteine ligase [Nonomuraea sp. 3-1Str]|uniref:carboxylate-amine ligase n=1 Tax=unclassified Nonomuraea TaxID=2593643 RepID=UPI002859DA5D|nr:glutamate--cysteine ligase [Nonomuraea sp. 3-1Str]MDR8408011.1 glutamate--cysteine ligase [Nonomuraea sp. 3-1Str]